MWIVALALRRPYTFVVMAIVIIILFGVTVVRTPTDIFPEINIPVVSVVWSYTGMSPQDMACLLYTSRCWCSASSIVSSLRLVAPAKNHLLHFIVTDAFNGRLCDEPPTITA